MRRLRTLTLAKALLALEALVALAGARAAVLFVPIAKLAVWLHRDAKPAAPLADHQHIQRIGGYLRLVGRYTPWRSLCLEQALAAWWMLRRRGLASTLHLGVAKEDEQLAAHAWLECAGAIVTGARGKQRFTPVVQLGRAKQVELMMDDRPSSIDH